MKFKAYIKTEIEEEYENITEFFKNHLQDKIELTHIDGKKADQVCEGCEKAITIGDVCYQWSDDVFTCKECGGVDEDHLPIRLS